MPLTMTIKPGPNESPLTKPAQNVLFGNYIVSSILINGTSIYSKEYQLAQIQVNNNSSQYYNNYKLNCDIMTRDQSDGTTLNFNNSPVSVRMKNNSQLGFDIKGISISDPQTGATLMNIAPNNIDFKCYRIDFYGSLYYKQLNNGTQSNSSIGASNLELSGYDIDPTIDSGWYDFKSSAYSGLGTGCVVGGVGYFTVNPKSYPIYYKGDDNTVNFVRTSTSTYSYNQTYCGMAIRNLTVKEKLYNSLTAEYSYRNNVSTIPYSPIINQLKSDVNNYKEVTDVYIQPMNADVFPGYVYNVPYPISCNMQLGTTYYNGKQINIDATNNLYAYNDRLEITFEDREYGAKRALTTSYVSYYYNKNVPSSGTVTITISTDTGCEDMEFYDGKYRLGFYPSNIEMAYAPSYESIKDHIRMIYSNDNSYTLYRSDGDVSMNIKQNVQIILASHIYIYLIDTTKSDTGYHLYTLKFLVNKSYSGGGGGGFTPITPVFDQTP